MNSFIFSKTLTFSINHQWMSYTVSKWWIYSYTGKYMFWVGEFKNLWCCCHIISPQSTYCHNLNFETLLCKSSLTGKLFYHAYAVSAIIYNQQWQLNNGQFTINNIVSRQHKNAKHWLATGWYIVFSLCVASATTNLRQSWVEHSLNWMASVRTW